MPSLSLQIHFLENKSSISIKYSMCSVGRVLVSCFVALSLMHVPISTAMDATLNCEVNAGLLVGTEPSCVQDSVCVFYSNHGANAIT